MSTRQCLLLVTLGIAAGLPAPGHEGIVVGHSPPDPNGAGQCPTVEPLRMFLLPDPRLGGGILHGAAAPVEPGVATPMVRLATNALLARPEFGGFVYVQDNPGLDFVNPANACHAMTTAHTGGQPFTVALRRDWWPSEAQLSLADPFGSVVLTEAQDDWVYGTEAGGHVHPLWLCRRAGRYHLSSRIVSSHFLETPAFSLTFESNPACGAPRQIDLTSVYNADVVDDGSGAAAPFDAGGHAWVRQGAYGTTRGLPADGRLDVFQLGGADGSGLAGAAGNCLFDDGVHSAQAFLDLSATAESGHFESLEMLVAGAGTFSSADVLVVRLGYARGAVQAVTIRRAAAGPRFFPLRDWQVAASPPPLAIGPGGARRDGGFARSTGSGIDLAAGNRSYFQRVTFPVDPTRELVGISIDDYTGAGRVGIFALTAIAERPCPSGDADQDGDVDADDFAMWAACAAAPGVPADHDCLVFDFDFDLDVDVLDVAEFQKRFEQAP